MAPISARRSLFVLVATSMTAFIFALICSSRTSCARHASTSTATRMRKSGTDASGFARPRSHPGKENRRVGADPTVSRDRRGEHA